MTEKETRGDTDRTTILFLIPWYFSVKYQGIEEQHIIVLSMSPLVSFLFLSFIELLVQLYMITA